MEDDARPTVVVVDDEPDVLFLVERLLSRDGFEVGWTASDGASAIELVREVQPDVVLLDLAMPDLDGETALPSIVRESPRTMVAIFSAHLDPERAERLLQHGAFTAYDKSELERLPSVLAEDLAGFRRVLAGEDAVPAWRHRYRASP